MIKVTIQDGGLGIRRPSTSRLQAKVGVSSAGVANQVVRLRDPNQIAAQFGTGPLVTALGDSFAAGAQDLLVVRAAADVAGTVSTVTSTKTGGGDMSVSGNPLDDYQVIVEILSTGGLNAATFRYSLDGGDTWSVKQTVPTGGTFAIPNSGLTLTFTAGAQPDESFKAGDRYEFTTTAPTASVESLTAALDALLQSSEEFELVHIVGPTTSAVWTMLDTRAAALAEAGRYLHFVAETRGPAGGETAADWANAMVEETAAFTSRRVSLVAGRAEVTDLITQRIQERNIAGIYTGRLASIAEHRSPAEVALGPLPNVVRLAPAGITAEDLAKLDAAQLITLKTILGLPGFYINEGHVKAPDGSDYQTVEVRRIMDRACRLVRQAALRYDHAEGTPEGVAALEAQLTAPLENEMAGQILNGRVVIPDQDILTTGKLVARIRITPIPIMREIEIDIGLEPLQQGV